MSTSPVASSPRSSTSAASSSVAYRPEGVNTVTPHLVCADAPAAIEFYKTAFGAEEMSRLNGPNGKIIHAHLKIGDSAIFLFDESPECGAFGPKSLKGSSVTIHLYVRDADALVARAAEAGAKVVMPVQEMFWGDRYGRIEDPSGHQWSVGTHVRDLSPAEIKKGMEEACG